MSGRKQRLSIRSWKAKTPDQANRLIEVDWLEEHFTYGGAIHEETAKAIVSALKEPSHRERGHTLYFKLFAEFANALEVAGARGWIVRTRRDHPYLLLDAFLTYPHSAPRDFYMAARRNRSASLINLLKLPPEQRVIEALLAGMPAMTPEDARKSMIECVQLSKALASRYFGGNQIIRSTYNRAKHGATMYHNPSSLQIQQFYVLAPHLDISGKRDKARYDLAKFTVNKQNDRRRREERRAGWCADPLSGGTCERAELDRAALPESRQ